jgi:hypothetical protein
MENGDRMLTLTAADDTLSVTVELDSAMNYALAHNGITPLKAVQIFNNSEAPVGPLLMEIDLDSVFDEAAADPLAFDVPEINPGEGLEYDAYKIPWTLKPTVAARIDETTMATVSVRLVGDGHALEDRGTVALLAHDEWWSLSISESLAAFVTPRAPAIRELLGEASALLGSRTGDPSLQGYQAGSGRAAEIARAIYDAMAAREIRYSEPPPSFEGTGQKIRSPDDVLAGQWGTCLDLATTYAAALESAGLNPVIVVCNGHAFAGLLRDDLQLPEVVLKDPPAILNFYESGLLLPVETTMLCRGERNASSFDDAVLATRARFHQGVRFVVDVSVAHLIVKPLPAITSADGVRVVEVERSPQVRQAPPGPMAQGDPAEPAQRGARRDAVEFPPRVARWRSSLLDLSFRNPLLNMRPGRAALPLHVPDGALGSIEDRLFSGGDYRLIPSDQLAEIQKARGARDASDVEPEVLRNMLDGGDMFVACTEASYLSRLRGIARRARTVREETGANNLYVTLGLLEWQEDNRSARAPLFLLPVDVVGHRGRPFTLRIQDGVSAEPNQCLLEKLRGSHGLEIPQFSQPDSDDSGIDLPAAIQAIRLALIKAGLPFAIEESAHLALLQFSTLQMWQDLTENWSAFVGNPVVRHLVETPTDTFTDPVLESEPAEDAEATSWCPVPFDGSQLQAVSWAEAGRSFVIEGPPGTGKSQTITNLIANALAAGKTVLFVAEKQAALDVVRRRLARIGLGDLCLNLHGKTQSPDEIRQQLRAALNIPHSSNADAWDATRAEFRTTVANLARYPRALHEPGGAGMSAWQARQTMLTSVDGASLCLPPQAVAGHLDADGLYRLARELTQALYDVGTRLDAHPWRLARLDDTPSAERRTSLTASITALSEARQALRASGISPVAESLGGVKALDELAAWANAVCGSGWCIDATVPGAAAPAEETDSAHAHIAKRLRELVAKAAPHLVSFRAEALEGLALDALLERSRAADRKLLKGKARAQIIAELTPALVEGAQLDRATLTTTIESLRDLQERAGALSVDARGMASAQIPDDWAPLLPGAETSLARRLGAYDATQALLKAQPSVAESLAELDGHELGPDAAVTAAEARDTWLSLAELVATGPDAVKSWMTSDCSLVEAIDAGLGAWRSDGAGGLVALGRWIEVSSRLERLRAAGFGELAELVETGTLPVEEIEGTLRRTLARAVLAERLASPVLDGFDGVARDRAIGRFTRAGDEIRREMVIELPAKIVGGRGFSADRLVGRVGELDRELGRKRGGLRIRELFSRYGPIIAQLSPCLMMSPSSVAQYLPAGALEVDLVVFDEASQIRVAEAVGAMGRGKSTVIVGDSKQMPPTNVAAVTMGEDLGQLGSGNELEVPADMESVLSEAVESHLPRLLLSWHYRSQHESLIAFSNQSYYENRLSSFPRSPGPTENLGVGWRRVDGSFERGAARVNRVEAKAIVGEIRGRLAVDERASIGVVTFNMQQRDLVLDMLEESGDERVARSLANEDEPLFVKNLENVQGDERDLILFSLAFSPDPQTGKLPLNFGPLLQAGGEKRLNVAVTRARAQVIVFSSFDPAHIDLSRSSSRGLADLRGYLEMAQRGDDSPLALRLPTARDRHQEEVAAALRDAGLEVREQIGLSDFTVDLGVAASPDGPWTALFLDGPSYRSRRTVSDRESLPYAVLTNSMGWACTQRIWLPDWVRDRAEVLDRVTAAVRDAPAASPADVASASEVHGPVLPVSDPQPTSPVTEVAVDAAAPPLLGAAASENQSNEAPSGTELPPGAEHFNAADTDVRGTVEVLDALPAALNSRALVAEQIQDILRVEAPISAARLARIVGRRFSLRRLAGKRAALILALVPQAQREQTSSGEFVWAAGQRPEDHRGYRIPRGEPELPLEEVAPREILNAMTYLAWAGGGIASEELLRETNAIFGYGRLASRSRGILENVVRTGVHDGPLRLDGDLIVAGT